MASSENLASLEPFISRPALADLWTSGTFFEENESVTKGFRRSLLDPNTEAFSLDAVSPLNIVKPDTGQTPIRYSLSNSDTEIAVSKRIRDSFRPNGGKVMKRKSRASTRCQTTFIKADASNFRQMVQQVTGVKFGMAQLPIAPFLNSEPQRPGVAGGRFLGCPPTLDTSAFLLDPADFASEPSRCEQRLTFSQAPSLGVNNGGGAGVSFGSFPTLESWELCRHQC